MAQAIPYWQRAGQRAIERSAHIEAISHLSRGLEVLATLPDTPMRTQHELALQTTLGPALIATKGYAAPDVAQVYTRARELCRQVGETPQLFPVLWGLWYFYTVQADISHGARAGGSVPHTGPTRPRSGAASAGLLHARDHLLASRRVGGGPCVPGAGDCPL